MIASYERDFTKATYAKWAKMRERAKEQVSARGRITRPAIAFSLTVDQFRAWALSKFDHKGGTARCEYCSRPVSILTFIPDHKQPLARGGTTGTDNLAVACEECNTLKGMVSEAWFRFFLKCLWEMPDPDAADIRGRLLKAEKLAAQVRRSAFLNRKGATIGKGSSTADGPAGDVLPEA